MSSNFKFPKVSVLIPCFNSETFLSECLTSLQKQTLQEIEFICINDGSTDSTQLIIEKFHKLDNRFILINKNNSGYGDSLNLGLDTAKGEFIGIVEPDDFVEPDMFALLYEMAVQYNLDVARCSYFYHSKYGDTEQKWPSVPKNVVVNPIECISVFKQGPSVWANLYKNSWLQRNKLRFLTTPGASYQDTSFTFKAYFCARKFMMTDHCLLHYRIDNEKSSVHDKKKIYCVIDEWNEIYNFVFSKQIQDVPLIEKLAELQHRTYLWNLGRLDHEGKKKFIKEWHLEAKYRRRTKRTHLLKLSLLHFIIEGMILYCPNVLMLYNKELAIVRILKKLAN